jgi:hypothetical protein
VKDLPAMQLSRIFHVSLRATTIRCDRAGVGCPAWRCRVTVAVDRGSPRCCASQSGVLGFFYERGKRGTRGGAIASDVGDEGVFALR